MLPAARLGDLSSCPADSHGCPGCPHPVTGPSISGSENVNGEGDEDAKKELVADTPEL